MIMMTISKVLTSGALARAVACRTAEVTIDSRDLNILLVAQAPGRSGVLVVGGVGIFRELGGKLEGEAGRGRGKESEGSDQRKKLHG